MFIPTAAMYLSKSYISTLSFVYALISIRCIILLAGLVALPKLIPIYSIMYKFVLILLSSNNLFTKHMMV